MRLLVTGCNGFIGRHLCRRLLSTRNSVVGIDMAGTPVPGVEYTEMDLGVIYHDTQNLLTSLVKDTDAAFHLAGHASVKAMENDRSIFDIDGRSFIQVLDACRRTRKPILVTSSAYVYRINKRGEPNTAYGRLKLAWERLIHASQIFGLQACVLRLFNVYGPGQEQAGTYRGTFITDTIKHMLTSEEPLHLLNPQSTRDFVYVTDIVRAMELSMTALMEGELSTERPLDVGSERWFPLFKVVDILKRHTAFKGEILHGEQIEKIKWAGSIPNLAPLRRLGWEPVPLEDGLCWTVDAARPLYHQTVSNKSKE